MAEDDELGYSHGQQVALSLLGFLSALLSAIGSSCILSIILRDREHKLKRTYHRLLLGLSISDVVNSVRGVLAGFLLPSDTPDVWYAYGSRGTCTALGFSVQLGFSSPLYSACLATYFFMVVQPKLKGHVDAVEPIMHAIAILFPLSTAIAGVPMELYNPVETGSGCWIAPYPKGCADDEEAECIRGEYAATIGMFFGGLPLGISLVVILVTMMGLYISVWRQMRLVEDRYSTVTGQNLSPSAIHRLRQTRSQAQLYVGAYILSYAWIGILRIVEAFDLEGNGFVLALVAETLFPLQGFWNFLIYIRPRYMDMRRESPHDNRIKTLAKILETKGRSGGGTGRLTIARADDPSMSVPPAPSRGALITSVLESAVESANAEDSTDSDNDSFVCNMKIPSRRTSTRKGGAISEDSFDCSLRMSDDELEDPKNNDVSIGHDECNRLTNRDRHSTDAPA